MDNVTFDVEDGLVYIEGVVSSEEQRRAISSAVSHLDGLAHMVTCLATEHVLPAPTEVDKSTLYPPQVYMHYYSH